MAIPINHPKRTEKPWHGIEHPEIDLSDLYYAINFNFERKNKMKITMPPGEYYIGDLCYVIEYEWSNLCDKYFCNDAYGRTQDGMTFPYEDRKCFIGSTKYGDGLYQDNFGREYGVDSGTIGIMLYALRDKDDNGGNVVFFDKEFQIDYFDGVFTFGDIVIDTGEGDKEDDSYLEFDNDEIFSDDWMDELEDSDEDLY